MWAQVYFVLSQSTRLTDGRTERTSQYRALHYMQSRGKNDIRLETSRPPAKEYIYMTTDWWIIDHHRSWREWTKIVRLMYRVVWTFVLVKRVGLRYPGDSRVASPYTKQTDTESWTLERIALRSERSGDNGRIIRSDRSQ